MVAPILCGADAFTVVGIDVFHANCSINTVLLREIGSGVVLPHAFNFVSMYKSLFSCPAILS